jgi:threonine dehydratase
VLTPERERDLADAAAGLDGVAVRTPLIPADGFEHPVRLKAEHLQPVAAFKLRGAWTAIRRLDDEARARGVVTSSSGNHGYALAWAAQRHGIRAVVVMPESTAQVKQDNVRGVGGDVRLVGASRGPEQHAEAERLAEAEGLVMIPPYDHPDVIAGQATCTLEILEDWPEVAAIALPVGGGGLLAGACLAVRSAARAVRLYAIEPEGIPKLSAAIEADQPVDLPAGTSLADGLLTRSIGRLTWPHIRGMVSGVFGVSDVEIRAGMRWLRSHGIRAEPSGAATAAALLAGKLPVSGPTALVVSGGNVDPARYDHLVSG